MIQIMIIFYGPGLIFGLPLLPRFTAALVAFSVNYACYFSEIYRGGMPKCFSMLCTSKTGIPAPPHLK